MIKRSFDFMVAFFLLVLFSPLFLLISIMSLIMLKRPIIFIQQRPGLYGRPFYIYKFRTMLATVDSNNELLEDRKRLTAYGKFLRRFSLDELPQLINIIRGDLSLVGPRPLLMEYLSLYSPEQNKRHDVRPGLTGWAQVNGRNAISWEERFAFDVWYVNNRSFWIDIKIMWLTSIKLFRRDGISAEGHATTEPFKGNSK